MTKEREKKKAFLAKIGELPALPHTVAEVLAMVKDTESSLEDISEIIETDPALATKILRVANSPFYGLSRSVGTIKLALVILGTREIGSIAIGVAVMEVMGTSLDAAFEDELVKHATECAGASKLLSEKLDLSFDGEQFICGLLHDIGKMALRKFLPDEYRKIREIINERGGPADEAEFEVMGCNHAEIGYWLTEAWALPYPIVNGIGSHHADADAIDSSEAPLLTAVVATANRLVQVSGSEISEETLDALAALPTWEKLTEKRSDLNGVQLKAFIKDFLEQINATRSLPENSD